MRPLHAEIDLSALSHNLAVARYAAPHTRMLAVIKANGYGHGLEAVASSLAHADGLAVSCIGEALALRAAGVNQRIVLLEGFFDASELPEIDRWQLECVIHQENQLQALLTYQPHRPLPVWIKINTGMNRLGFRPEETRRVWNALAVHPRIASPVRLMTHLACADELDNPATLRQYQLFQQCTHGLAAESSLANSAGILGWQERCRWPDPHAQWARPGLMLYGVPPFAGASAQLRPAMRLRSAIIQVNPCHQGEAVGYGGAWTCPQDMPIGVVAAGYGDGYPRHAAAGTPVWVNGHIVPLVGRVSMDMITVDLRPAPHTRVGDPVELWGESVPVTEVARHANTIAYTLLTGVTPRVRRIYTGHAPDKFTRQPGAPHV